MEPLFSCEYISFCINIEFPFHPTIYIKFEFLVLVIKMSLIRSILPAVLWGFGVGAFMWTVGAVVEGVNILTGIAPPIMAVLGFTVASGIALASSWGKDEPIKKK